MPYFIAFTGIYDSKRGVWSDEVRKDPLKALIWACESGDLEAVMAISPYIEDINSVLPNNGIRFFS